MTIKLKYTNIGAICNALYFRKTLGETLQSRHLLSTMGYYGYYGYYDVHFKWQNSFDHCMAVFSDKQLSTSRGTLTENFVSLKLDHK